MTTERNGATITARLERPDKNIDLMINSVARVLPALVGISASAGVTP